MTARPTTGVPPDPVGDYIARLRLHLLRLGEGHDPFGHLLAVERLARTARAEWCEAHDPSRLAGQHR